MADNTPMTRERLVAALKAKGCLLTDTSEDQIRGYITHYALEHVIAGRHLGKPVRFHEAFALVYGRKL